MLLKSSILIAAALMVAPLHDELPDLQIGDALPAPDVKMKNVTNKEVTLAGLSQQNGLLVIFSCNTCPFVVGSEGSEGWEGRYPGLNELARKSGIGMVLVNSNEAKREKGDGLNDMQVRYRSKGFGCAYVLDAGHVVADAFGARTTPHVYLFDKDHKLVYKGAIDDSVESAAAVQQPYLKNAMTALAAGVAIDPNSTRNIGCSIKRVAPEH